MKIVAYMLVASLMIATPSAFAATSSLAAEGGSSCPGLVGIAGCAAKLVTKSACYVLFEDPNCVGTTSSTELASAE